MNSDSIISLIGAATILVIASIPIVFARLLKRPDRQRPTPPSPPPAPRIRCAHAEAVPVESILDTAVVLAHWCPSCQTQLPADWTPPAWWEPTTPPLHRGRSGCDDCTYVEDRRLCDPEPRLILARPCPAHRAEAFARVRQLATERRRSS